MRRLQQRRSSPCSRWVWAGQLRPVEPSPLQQQVVKTFKNILHYWVTHCTMGLSVALRIWNIWKCKGLVFAQFDQISINQVLTGRRLPKYSMKNIGIWYLSKILEIWAKNVKGGSVKVEIFGGDIWDPCEKKPQNIFFDSRPLHCEI